MKAVSPLCDVKDVVKATTKVVDFAKDPFGYIASQLQRADESMANNLLPAVVKALHPDFTVSWFVKAYEYSFAMAVLVWGVLIMLEFLGLAQGKNSGADVLESLLEATPKFFIGSAFAPAAAMPVMALFGALCDSMVQWGGGAGGMKGATKKFGKLITSTDIGSIVGGQPMAILLFGMLLLALAMIAITLLFMYITLYCSGSVFPLGWVWITKTGLREKGWKIVRIFGGILAAQPLVFFMLSLVLSMVAANMFSTAGDGNSKGVNEFIGLVGGVLAFSMIAFTPFAANKWGAGVLPTEASPGGAGASGWGGGRGGGGGGRGGAGKSSSSDSQLGQVSRNNGGEGASTGGAEAAGGGAEAGAAGGGAGAAGAGGEAAAGGGAAAGGAAAGPLGMAAAAAVSKGKEAFDKARDGAEEATEDASSDGGSDSGSGSGGELSDAANSSDGGSPEDSGGGADGAGDKEARGGGLSDAASGDKGSGDKGSGDKGSGGKGSDSDSGNGEDSGGSSFASRLAGAASSAHGASGNAMDKGAGLAGLVEEQTMQHTDHQHDQAPRARR